MFKQVIKWTLLLTLWKNYKRHIVLTLGLFILLSIVSLVHDDFIQYQGSLTRVNESLLAWSFAVKWLSYLVLLATYAWLVTNSSSNKNTKLQNEDLNSLTTNDTASVSQTQDPFVNIRQKQKLRTKADMIIEKGKLKGRGNEE